jgi:hypothetical protein
MEGHGAYNRSSRVQAAGIAATLPLLEQTARTVPIESSGRAVVVPTTAPRRATTRCRRSPPLSAC